MGVQVSDKVVYQVYIVLNLVNGKKYVGSTKQSLHKRFHQHIYDSRNSNRRKTRGLSKAIYKYGEDKFIIEQLCSFDSKKECLKKETELINYYETVKNGYNMLSVATMNKPKSSSDKKSQKWKKLMSKIRKEKWEDPVSREKMINGRWAGYVKKKKYKTQISKEEISRIISESNARRSKTYYFISPNGVKTKVTHLPSFCEKNNLDSTCMCRVSNGIYKNHKGWTLA